MQYWRGPLLQAQAQRRAQRALRARVVTGQIGLADALGDQAVARVRVAQVIAWLPGYGPKTAVALLEAQDWPIWPNRRCGELTDRQRRRLQESAG